MLIYSPSELDKKRDNVVSLDSKVWKDWIAHLFKLADLVIEVDLETEKDTPPDRPRY